MPGAVGQIARFAGKGRRAGYNDVEKHAGRQRGKEVRAHCRDTVLKPVGAGVFGRGKRGVGVYVYCGDLCGARPGCGERYSLELARHMARVTPTTLVCFGDRPRQFTTADGLRGTPPDAWILDAVAGV